MVNLPKGTGKNIRGAVMAKGNKAKESSEAGADIVGDDDLVNSINAGNIDFDVLIATPDMMPSIGKVAKILGPKGLMPNPKLGTVSNEIVEKLLLSWLVFILKCKNSTDCDPYTRIDIQNLKLCCQKCDK